MWSWVFDAEQVWLGSFFQATILVKIMVENM